MACRKIAPQESDFFPIYMAQLNSNDDVPLAMSAYQAPLSADFTPLALLLARGRRWYSFGRATHGELGRPSHTGPEAELTGPPNHRGFPPMMT